MIIAINPESAAWIRLAARTVLVLHIGGAAVGLGAGTVALAFPKGGTVHRWAGNAFFVAMLTMSLLGAATAPLLPTPPQALQGSPLLLVPEIAILGTMFFWIIRSRRTHSGRSLSPVQI
jgi:hypothetical protein